MPTPQGLAPLCLHTGLWILHSEVAGSLYFFSQQNSWCGADPQLRRWKTYPDSQPPSCHTPPLHLPVWHDPI